MVTVIIVIGVTGAGKTVVGQRLAEALHWEFFDADRFHSPENIAKMSQGRALSDQDREPWLGQLQALLLQLLQEERPAVLACSALKQIYRDRLKVDPQRVGFVYLKGEYDVIAQRLQNRQDHYAKVNLLQSQFQILEEPQDALYVDIRQTLEQVVRSIEVGLQLGK